MSNTNLRIIGDNAVDRAALSASSTSGLLAVTNLQTGKKSNVWRATGTSARLGATWTSPELVQGVAAPFCNWSPTATWRVRLTSEVSKTNLLASTNTFSSGWTLSSVSVAGGVASPDGANNASTLTATAANATISQSQTVTAGPFTASIFIRRRTGSGAVSIRNTANTAWIGLALSSSWTRFANDGGTSGTSTLLSLQLATSGDAVDVCFAQLESGAITSYYAGTRPLGYIDSWQSYTYDSGSVLACPAPSVFLRGWTAAQSTSAYAYGGGACARLWLPSSISAYGMAIDIVDASNLQGYLEVAGALVCGPYWSPSYNASTLSETFVDAAIHARTDAGDLWSDASTIHKKVPIELEYMPATDRATLANILRASRAYPIFMSVFPGIADLELERAHTVYGKRMSDSEVAVQAAIMYGTKIEVESI